jgi:hypothetical protein
MKYKIPIFQEFLYHYEVEANSLAEAKELAMTRFQRGDKAEHQEESVEFGSSTCQEIPTPKQLGEVSTCTQCGKPIEYIGPGWRHINSTPRHKAMPGYK